jgi:hypothetical protein
MEMKKLHMGTMSFGADTMDEVVHQLSTAFGADCELVPPNMTCLLICSIVYSDPDKARLIFYWYTAGHSRPSRYVRTRP